MLKIMSKRDIKVAHYAIVVKRIIYESIATFFGITGRLLLFPIFYWVSPLYRIVVVYAKERSPMSADGVLLWYKEEEEEYVVNHTVAEWLDLIGTYRIAVEDGNYQTGAWILMNIMTLPPPICATQLKFTSELHAWFKSQRVRGRGPKSLDSKRYMHALGCYVTMAVNFSNASSRLRSDEHVAFITRCGLLHLSGNDVAWMWAQ